MKHHSIFLKTILCLALLLLLSAASVAQARSIAPPPLPSRGALDIGQVGQSGVFTEQGTTDRVWGSGNDIWGQHDQFHYVWHDLPADGQIVAQVQSQDATAGWAKAGIMLRETVNDNATNVFLAVTPQHGVIFQWRGATNGWTHQRSGPQVMAPVWLKLVRHHSTITGFASQDGTTWLTVSSVTLSMQATSTFGLAVTAHSNRARSRAVFTHVALTVGTPPAALTATRVWGQGGSFTTNTANNGGVSANSLDYPWGVMADSSGNLYVGDCSNNRVLYYPAGTTTPTRVYGQAGSFTSGTVNNGGVSASSLDCPQEMVLDSSGNLYIDDESNHRMLYYLARSTTATRVYGQGGSFTTNTANNGGVSANSLTDFDGEVLDSNGNLYITDYANNRILFYPAGQTTATRVYGQGGSFTTNTANNGGISASSLSQPWGVKLDSRGNLYVADLNNNRVLFYPAGQTTATRVYGQGGSFTTNTANNGGISASSLSGPTAIALDSSGNLYVEDDNNNRILFYPAGTTTATQVWGQGGSFIANTTNNGGVSASSLNDPEGMTLDSNDNLYVADSSNNRVLLFPHG